jgi:hypothetical protein
MIVVLWVLLKLDERWVFGWALAAAVSTGVSGLFYVWDGSRQLSAHPTSSASPTKQEKPAPALTAALTWSICWHTYAENR